MVSSSALGILPIYYICLFLVWTKYNIAKIWQMGYDEIIMPKKKDSSAVTESKSRFSIYSVEVDIYPPCPYS